MNTQRPNRDFSVVLELRMWIVIWGKNVLKLIAKGEHLLEELISKLIYWSNEI